MGGLLHHPPLTTFHPPTILHPARYELSLLAMWGAVLRREFLLFTRNKVFFIAGAVQVGGASQRARAGVCVGGWVGG